MPKGQANRTQLLTILSIHRGGRGQTARARSCSNENHVLIKTCGSRKQEKIILPFFPCSHVSLIITKTYP